MKIPVSMAIRCESTVLALSPRGTEVAPERVVDMCNREWAQQHGNEYANPEEEHTNNKD